MSEELGLGRIITKSQKRDAIHIAVLPVIAGQMLKPGEHVGLAPNEDPLRVYCGAWLSVHAPDAQLIGIIDPYLRFAAAPGQRCWCYLYPGSVSSLRHVWTHDDIPEEKS